MKDSYSLNIIRKTAQRIAKTEFVSKAINENADLIAFKEKPSTRLCYGIAPCFTSGLVPMLLNCNATATKRDEGREYPRKSAT